ncbi:MAG: hypothetical protein H8D43_03300 [Chloroflexi bacterium]|nr:hypothetical protein [Chloroflexota bacterium]
MNSNVGKALAGLGGILAVICFFLPWVETRSIRGILPILESILGLLRPQLGDMVDSLQRWSSLSGFELAFRLPLASTPFKILVALPLVLGLLTLIRILISSLSSVVVPQAVDVAQAALCTVALVLLIYNIPNIERLGHGSNALVSVLAALLGFRLRLAFWGSLLALVLMATGTALGAAEQPDYREDDSFSWG